jgi:hypothetical protein
MSSRFWFYLLVAIVISGLLSFLLWSQSRIASDQLKIEQDSLASARESMNSYLAKQTDGRKLVTLAKRVSDTRPELVEPIILKAYELLPNSRDVAILASAYRPELKEKIKELDPLYEQN